MSRLQNPLDEKVGEQGPLPGVCVGMLHAPYALVSVILSLRRPGKEREELWGRRVVVFLNKLHFIVTLVQVYGIICEITLHRTSFTGQFLKRRYMYHRCIIVLSDF